MGRIIPYIMENKKCLKPTTSIDFKILLISQCGITKIALGHGFIS
jgi:hypothetical protein